MGVPVVFGLLAQRTANIILQMSENNLFRFLFLKVRVGNVERLEGERAYCKYLYCKAVKLATFGGLQGLTVMYMQSV